MSIENQEINIEETDIKETDIIETDIIEELVQEPLDVEVNNIEIDRESCIIDTNEDTINYVELKIKMYEDRIDSEKRVCAHARNEHKNGRMKAKGYFACAGILLFITMLFNVYTRGAISVGALLTYPMVGTFTIGAIICVIKGVKWGAKSKIIIDSYSLKYKEWSVVLGESRARTKIYKEEIDRLNILLEEMKAKREKVKANLQRLEEERKNNKNLEK